MLLDEPCVTFASGNWENELKKWVGDHCPTFAVHSDPKKRLRQFIQVRKFPVQSIITCTQSPFPHTCRMSI
jgi:hypothetical protein